MRQMGVDYCLLYRHRYACFPAMNVLMRKTRRPRSGLASHRGVRAGDKRQTGRSQTATRCRSDLGEGLCVPDHADIGRGHRSR